MRFGLSILSARCFLAPSPPSIQPPLDHFILCNCVFGILTVYSFIDRRQHSDLEKAAYVSSGVVTLFRDAVCSLQPGGDEAQVVCGSDLSYAFAYGLLCASRPTAGDGDHAFLRGCLFSDAGPGNPDYSIDRAEITEQAWQSTSHLDVSIDIALFFYTDRKICTKDSNHSMNRLTRCSTP